MSDVTRLPRKSGASREHALRVLAVAKFLKARIKTSEDQAKAYLKAKELNPKDRVSVMWGGADVATVSYSAPSSPAPKIVDGVAFASWCDAHGIDHHGYPETKMVFPEWVVAKAHLESIIERNGGEIPDGVEVPEQADGYLSVRQSADQLMRLMDSIKSESAESLLDSVAPLIIEGTE